ncbi:hypothetical protein BH10BAC2_BH10BAC2_44200 [soil metagenome]
MMVVKRESSIVNEEKKFFDPNCGIRIKHRCVARLYFLINIEQSVQVSDTTKMTKEQKVKYRNLSYTEP